MTCPTIIVSDRGGGFAVAPIPTVPDRPDLNAFAADHRVALAFARLFSASTGWPVDDQSIGAAG
jgi:hypothetical protein